jgi:hypothetical protein
MHSVLIVLMKPDDSNRIESDRWKSFLANTKPPGSPASRIERLSETLWLIPVDHGLPLLADLVSWAEKHHIEYQGLFFDKKPEWIYSKGHPLAGSAKPEAITDKT